MISQLSTYEGAPIPVVVPERLPQVSVIVPAYNVAPYIAETIKSVLAQTFTDYELIVVNDGSPDTASFERALQPYLEGIVYLKQENQGASVARNAGLRAARGEFVAFLDADDIWLPEYLAEQMKFMAARGCDLACADAILFGEAATDGRRYMEVLMNSAPIVDDVSFLQLLDAERSLITSGVVARRQAIIETGLFDDALRRGQDLDLWLRLALAGKRLSYHRDALLQYRCRTDGLTGDAISSHRRELKIFDKIEESYELAPEERAVTARVIRNRRALLYFEMGKLYAASGELEQSNASFRRAHDLKPTAKTRIALWLIRNAPNPMKAICRRRV
jgi:glycosyltransferase involved in cell wall biosynthesis